MLAPCAQTGLLATTVTINSLLEHFPIEKFGPSWVPRGLEPKGLSQKGYGIKKRDILAKASLLSGDADHAYIDRPTPRALQSV